MRTLRHYLRALVFLSNVQIKFSYTSLPGLLLSVQKITIPVAIGINYCQNYLMYCGEILRAVLDLGGRWEIQDAEILYPISQQKYWIY